MYQSVHCYIVFHKETVDHVPKCKSIPNIPLMSPIFSKGKLKKRDLGPVSAYFFRNVKEIANSLLKMLNIHI